MHTPYHTFAFLGALIFLRGVAVPQGHTPRAAWRGLAGGEKGFQADVRVRQPTRLDWEFAAGAEAAKVPATYDSRAIRYQLFSPPTYTKVRPWACVVFISPGDDPVGWKAWEKVCEEQAIFFCSPYGVGNSVPFGRRVRTVLDVLDDVRRHYRIDPERTYLAGLGGGVPVAVRVASSLPEHFGGVVAVGGSDELPDLAYLRQRLRERLSFALVAGEREPARPGVVGMKSLLSDLTIRTQMRILEGQGYGLPSSEVLAEVYSWLDDDVKRRREDATSSGAAAGSADDVTPRRVLASASVARATPWLRDGDKLGQGVDLLEWVVRRCDRTEGAEKARALLEEVNSDAGKKATLTRQAQEREGRWQAVRARALEEGGQTGAARLAWEDLAKKYPGTAEGKKAVAEMKRLEALLARAAYLGVAFESDALRVQSVVAGGPADRAGLQAGDLVVEAGGEKVPSLPGLRRILAARRPGDRLALVVERGGKATPLAVQLGSLPSDR